MRNIFQLTNRAGDSLLDSKKKCHNDIESCLESEKIVLLPGCLEVTLCLELDSEKHYSIDKLFLAMGFIIGF